MTSFIVRAFPNQRDDFRYTIYQTVRGISVQKEQLIRGSRNRFHSIVVFQKSFVELDAIDVQADIAETCTLDACTEKIRDESVSWLYHLIRKEDQLETFGKYLFREMKLRKLMELNNISSYKLDQTYIEGTRLGNLSIAIIFGAHLAVRQLCEQVNTLKKSIPHEIDTIGDIAHWLLVLPMEIYKGPEDELKTFLASECELIMNEDIIKLISGKPMVLGSHLKNTATGARNDPTSQKTWRSQYREIVTNRNYNPTEPFWMDGRSDAGLSVLCTVTIFRNEVSFNLPGGKRELGETCMDAVFREVLEECGITFIRESTYQLHLHSGDDKTVIANMTFGNVQVTLDSEVLTRSLHCPVEGNLKSSELSSEASTLLEPAYEPMPWKEVWHFRPNVGTDTFLFEIGSFDHPHQSGNGKNSKQGSGVSHSSTEK